MSDQRIELIFTDEDEVGIEAHEYIGKGCAKDSKFLEDAIGAETLEEKKKAEWWLENSESVAFEQRAFGIDTTKLCG